MSEPYWGFTASIKHCQLCQIVIRETDKFCRHCGVKQDAIVVREAASTAGFVVREDLSDSYATNTLTITAPEEVVLPRPVSGPLLEAVIKGLSASASAIGYSKFTKQFVLILMSIPVWLMIVFLSPLDAWLATKSITKQP